MKIKKFDDIINKPSLTFTVRSLLPFDIHKDFSVNSMIMKISLPHILIAGRPNVGKSTFFNRLLGKRLSITSPVPGVTRDLLQNIFTLPNKTCCVLEDSAGFQLGSLDNLEKMAHQQTLKALESANLILFLVEVSSLVDEDFELIKYIRTLNLPTLLIVNKCDTSSHEYGAADLWKLGLGEPFPISAEHNRNFPILIKRIQEQIETLDIKVESKVPDVFLKMAILGRPNAGKSTLVNALCQNEKHLTSDIPGTTRDIVHSFFDDKGDIFEIIDTAGLRRASKIGESLEFYSSKRAEIAIEICDIAVLLIDITQGLTDQDKKIASKIVEKKKPILLVLTKSDLKEDLQTKAKDHKYFNDILSKEIEKVRSEFPVLKYAPLISISVKRNETLQSLLKKLRAIHKESGYKADEDDLKIALKRWCAFRLPYSKRSKEKVWLEGLQQVGNYPPRFVLQIRGDISTDYIRYIANNLRKEFNFSSVPLDIKIVHTS